MILEKRSGIWEKSFRKERRKGVFFSHRARDRGLDAKTRSRAKTLPNLASFAGAGAKSFQTQIRPVTPPQTLNSRNFPLFPGISRFRPHLSNITASANAGPELKYAIREAGPKSRLTRGMAGSVPLLGRQCVRYARRFGANRRKPEVRHAFGGLHEKRHAPRRKKTFCGIESSTARRWSFAGRRATGVGLAAQKAA